MAAASWRELDARRERLRKPMSRAEWSRLAAISESTITKGIRDDKTPRRAQRVQAELILEAAEIAAEQTASQMQQLGGELQRRLG